MAEDPDLTSLPPPPSADQAAATAANPDLNEGFHRISSRVLEVRIIVVGCILLGAVLVELAIGTYVWPQAGQALWRGLVFEMFSGREVGIPLSLGGGAPPWIVAQVSATQDIGVVCIAYPAFLWALHRYQDRDNFVMRRMRRLQAHAVKHRTFVHRWGPFGIFVFMLVPFLVNGPLLGAAVGRVSGIATKWLILPVVGATIVAAIIWTYAYDLLFGLIENLDPRIPPILTFAIVASLVLWGILGEVLDARKQAKRPG
ncbi:MAG: small multi-drug export protein [Candidatus Thermoplasmatota archaeon]